MNQAMLTRHVLASSTALIVALGFSPPDARAEADFSGQTIEIMVPFSEGGGTDTWARFNAPFLSEHLPGQPTVVVRNEPGGGSTKGANLFAARAEADGTEVLATSGSTQFPYLLGDPRVQYDYAEWTPFLAWPTGGVAYVSPKLGIESAAELDQLMGEDLVYGSQGATSLDLVPLLAFELLGLDVQAVMGMEGRGAGRLAFERGETNIDYQTSSAYLTNTMPLVEAGDAVPLFSWGVLDDQGEIVRDPTFPDLPSFKEAYTQLKGEEPSGPAWDAWKAFYGAGFAAQKMMVVPDGTPDDVVQAYQEAVRQMKEDSDYDARKESVLGTYEQVTGEQADALYEVATQVDPEARQWVRDWLSENYDVPF